MVHQEKKTKQQQQQKEKNNHGYLEKSWGMQCLELQHGWVSSRGCSSSLHDAVRVSPTEPWGSTQCSSAQPLTRGKWEAEADSASLSYAEKGVKSKAERKKNEAGRRFSINGRKQGNASFLSRWEKQLSEELSDSQSADYNSSLLHCQEERRMEQQL